MRTTTARVAGLLAALSFGLLATTASAQMSWSFDSGSAGWSQVEVDASTLTVTGSSALAYIPGYVMATASTESTLSFFSAPTTAADFSAYLNGSLTFSLASTNATAGNVVVLSGNNTTVYASAKAPLAGFVWTDCKVDLTASNFYTTLDVGTGALSGSVDAITFADILASLDALLIPVDFGQTQVGSPSAVTALDNVSFAAIPEPSTYAMVLGAATLAVAGFVRRRRKAL